MRVLLLSANTFQDPHPVYPLGLDYVARAVSDAHEVRILDANLLAGQDDLLANLSGFAPDAVGISLRNVDNASAQATRVFLEEARSLVRSVRRATHASVILGGSGFSLFPQRLLEELGADYGIVGEGERLADLLRALKSGEPKPCLDGVVLPGRSTYRAAPWQGAPARLDPARNAHTRFYLEHGGILNLQTKRGCPFRCIYCTYPILEGSDLRLFDPRDTAETAHRLQEAGARFLYITDSVVNAHEEHSLAVAEAMKAAGVSIPWGGFFSPRVTRRDYFHRLAGCGCTHVEFGTESLCEPMLRTYEKPFRERDVYAAHEQALEAGLHVAHYFLLGGPGESAETVQETLDRIENLDRGVFFLFSGIRIHPGTRVRAVALEEGLVAPAQDLLEPVFYTPRRIALPEINDLLEAAARGRGNWVTSRVAERMERVTRRLYTLGHTGVLWERLVR